jgi:hypothetical protein
LLLHANAASVCTSLEMGPEPGVATSCTDP